MDFYEKIKNIRSNLNLNQKQFAEILGVTQAAISRYEKNERIPDLVFLHNVVEKLNINPMWLLKDEGEMMLDDDLCSKANQLAVLNSRQDEFKNVLVNFIGRQTSLLPILSKIEKIKGQAALEKVTEFWSGDGARMLRVLYYFLIHLNKQKIQLNTDTLKQSFIEHVETFELPKSVRIKFMGSIGKKDYQNLVSWISDELDDASIFEIMSALPVLIEETQKQMNWFDTFLTKMDFYPN